MLRLRRQSLIYFIALFVQDASWTQQYDVNYGDGARTSRISSILTGPKQQPLEDALLTGPHREFLGRFSVRQDVLEPNF